MAMDRSKELKLMRDQIAEMMFSCKVTRCSGCNKLQLASPNEMKMNLKSYGGAGSLIGEIKKEALTVREALRIKEILDNYQKESDFMLYDALKRLQLMKFSVKTLKVTQIGKSVCILLKHRAEQIKHLALSLIEDWKVIVNEWIKATEATTASTPESVKASIIEEEEEKEGLPSPALD